MRRFAALPLLVALVAGCGHDTAPPPGVSVSLAQWRSDEAARRIQLAVRISADAPVYFADVQLVTPSFATLAPEKADVTLRKTKRTDIPLHFGKADCPSSGPPEVRPATVVARLRAGEEPLRRVVFEIPHPDPLLARLLREECAEHAVRQAAHIAFGPEWTRTGDAMRATLTLTRRGRGTVTVHGIDRTSHYIAAPATGGEPLIVLDAAAGSARAAVEITPGRCDPHAFAEAKKAFLFPVQVSVDGGEQHVVTVTPPGDVQHRLTRYALDVCGL